VFVIVAGRGYNLRTKSEQDLPGDAILPGFPVRVAQLFEE
jgi:hypothetical protein